MTCLCTTAMATRRGLPLLARSFSTAVQSEIASVQLAGTAPGQGRKVRIFAPSRVASQQGRCNTGYFKLQFEMTPKWENPLMGWTSTADVYSNIADANSGLTFKTVEAAKNFCAHNGWEVTDVKEAKKMIELHPATIKGKGRGQVKTYSDNFSHKRKGFPTYPGGIQLLPCIPAYVLGGGPALAP